MLRHLGTRAGALAGLPLRGLAPGGKRAGRDKGPRKTGELSTTHATGCGLMKGQGDPPLKPDSEYPPWLWELLNQEPTGKDLAAQYEGLGLSIGHLHRLWRLKNKERIKEANFTRAK